MNISKTNIHTHQTQTSTGISPLSILSPFVITQKIPGGSVSPLLRNKNTRVLYLPSRWDEKCGFLTAKRTNGDKKTPVNWPFSCLYTVFSGSSQCCNQTAKRKSVCNTGYIVSWYFNPQSTTMGYVRAGSKCPSTSYLFCTQVIKPPILPNPQNLSRHKCKPYKNQTQISEEIVDQISSLFKKKKSTHG